MEILTNLILNNPFAQNSLNYWRSFNWPETFLVFKITAAVISFGFLISIIYFFSRSSFLKLIIWQDVVEIITFRQYGQKKIVKRWEDIKRRIETGSESEQKLAVIDAEGILDEVFVRMGLSGASFGERLKQVKKERLPSLDEVARAHEIRNNIVHDPDYRLTPDQARKAIDIYEKALKELEVF